MRRDYLTYLLLQRYYDLNGWDEIIVANGYAYA